MLSPSAGEAAREKFDPRPGSTLGPGCSARPEVLVLDLAQVPDLVLHSDQDLAWLWSQIWLQFQIYFLSQT